MRPRLIALVSFAFVLYVAASLAAAEIPFGVGRIALAVAAAIAALAAVWSSGAPASSAVHVPVARLSIALSIALSARLSLSTHDLRAELLTALALPMVALELVRLARERPDCPRAIARRRWPFAMLTLGVVFAAFLGAAAAAPPLWLIGRSWIAPPAWSRAPELLLTAYALLAFALRLARRRLGSDARALAANLWGSIGLGSALAVTAIDRWVGDGTHDLARALAALLCLSGHWLMTSPERADSAAASARKLLALALAALVSGGLGYVLRVRLGADALALFVPCLIAFVLAYGAALRAVERTFSPGRGALLNAAAEVRRTAYGALDFPDFAARVLQPLRRAAGIPEAAPLLATFDPPRIAQLDAAGIARVQSRRLPLPLLAYVEQHAAQIAIVDQLRALLARRPDLVKVVAALDDLGSICAVPLRHEEVFEGLLIVARGPRSTPLALEELLALERLGQVIAPVAASFSSLERLRARAESAEQERRELLLRYEQRGNDVAELRGQLSALKAGLGVPPPEREPVHYSPAMRELLERLRNSSAQELPLLLHGETGLGFAALARFVHRASGREREPFVVFDCAAYHVDAALAQLFGVGEEPRQKPGLIELVGAGTLVLLELPALAPAVQSRLVEVLEERRLVLPGGGSAPFLGRIVASARAPAEALAASGALLSPLGSWFSKTCYRVPPLRERPEDFESLLLLALDRAARVLGSTARGIEAEALRFLLGYDWPGNEAELASVIETATARAKRSRLGVEDIVLGGADLPAGATFREQERAILLKALRKSGGHHARAARALGMKRAEFMAKLRENALDRPTQN